ncbi:MAG: hypothetical protein PHH44_03905 [bacterium]|nr:hypothetical protein [bacterium]
MGWSIMKKPRIAYMCPNSANKIFYLLVMAVFFITAIFVYPAQAVNYWVSNTGDDGNTGTTPATAFKSLQKAANTATAAGDVINVMDGTYSYWDNSALCDAARAATGDNYMAVCMMFYSGVTIKAQNRGLAKIIGSNESFGGNVCAGIEIWGGAPYNQGDNITVDGFEIDGRDTSMVVRMNDGICLNTSAANNIIRYNNIHNTSRNGISIGKTIGGGGDYDGHGYCNFNNVNHNICYSMNAAIYEYASCGQTVEYNLVRNSSYGFEIYARTAATNQSVYRYNISYSNTYGLNIDYKNEVGTGSNPTVAGWNCDTKVEYCTFANNSTGVRCGAGYLQLYRCIIANNSGTGIDESDNGWWDGCTDIKGDRNDVYNNGTNYNSISLAPTGDGLHAGESFWQDISWDPQFLNLGTGVLATSYELKNKYTPARAATGQTVTSPCIDYAKEIVVAPDIWSDVGAHRDSITSTNYIGYPDPPANLGQPLYVGGANSWTNAPYLIGTANLSDPVLPATAENVRYDYDISYEKSYASGGNIVWGFVWNLWGTAPFPYSSWWTSATLPAIPGCGEGQFHWRVRCEDNINVNSGNISDYTYAAGVAGADLIAFGIDITTPTIVNDLAGTTTMAATSATLTWNDVDDSLPGHAPATPAPAGYKRVSEVAEYNLYRSTFSCVAPWTWDTWKAQVIAEGLIPANNHLSKRIVEMRGAGLAGSPHNPFIDGLVVGDELLDTLTYYYTVTSVDYAGNESIQGNEVSINPGTPPGGQLVYLIDSGGQVGGGNNTPCYGTTVPVATDVSVDINFSTTTCNLTNYGAVAYTVGNNHVVRHYAKITTGSGANPPEIRFYYTTGTRRAGASASPGVPEVWTNVDPSSGTVGIQHHINGTAYTPVGAVDSSATYFYADIPTDIHAAGNSSWDANNPWGMVGVRISGHQKTDKPVPLADGEPEWINEKPGTANTYTYYVRRATGYKAANPGEKNDDVRLQPMRHVWNDLLQTLSSIRYFTPINSTPLDILYMSANRFTLPGLTDNKGDIFYGEYPGLYVRLAYADGQTGAGNSYITYCSSTTAYTTGWVNDNPLDAVSTLIVSGIDNNASDTFSGGFAGPFYGHFSFMKSPVNTQLMSLPESIDVRYYFSVRDGSDRGFCYGAGVTKTLATAQAGNQFCYTVMQDDYSRPYVRFSATDASALQPRSVVDPGNSSWISFYTIRAELWDLNDGNYSTAPAIYCNMISGRGTNSGIYHNPDPNVMGTATPRSPVHDTRVYYRISTTAPPASCLASGSDKYLTAGTTPNFNFIPDNADTIYTLAGNTTGYVQMTGPATGGQWTAQIPLNEAYAGQYLYYRIYICNDDHDPQAYDSPSANFITGAGVDTVSQDTTDAYNRHGVAGVGGAFANPYDSAVGGAREVDRDHGWATYTRYGGEIIGLKMIKIRTRVTIGGITKVITAYVNAEGNTVGNVIFTEMEKNEP